MSVNSKNVKASLDKHILADGFDPVMDMEKSHGSWLVDERDGTEYLDMFSMFASGAVGYNHPDIVSQRDRLAISAQNKPTLSDIYNVFYAEFLETFSQSAIPEYLPHVFFIEGGSLAVENSLKVAFDWKVRKNMSNGKGEKGSKIIHFQEAFHGRSGYTLSLTNTTDPRKTMYFPKFDWPRINNPYLRFPISDLVLEDVKEKEQVALNQIKSAIKNEPNVMAAIIIEPIQGEGGDHQFRDEFFVALRNLCDEFDMLWVKLKDSYKISTVRDSKYLQWRYLNHPLENNSLIKIDSNNKIIIINSLINQDRIIINIYLGINEFLRNNLMQINFLN